MLLLLRALGARAGPPSVRAALRRPAAPARSPGCGGGRRPPLDGPPRPPGGPGLPAPRCRPGLLLAGPAAACLGLLASAARCQEATAAIVPAVPAVPAPPRPEPEFPWAEFWTFLRPQLLALSAAVALALGAALLNVRIPALLGELVNVVARCARGHLAGYLRAARRPALRLLRLYVLQGLLTFGYIALLSRAGERVAGSMRKALFTSLLRQDVAFFDANRTGQLVNRLTADVQEFKSSFKLVISQGLRSLTQTAGCFVSLFLLSPKLTGLLLVVLPAVVGAGTLLGSVLRRFSRQAQEQVAKATGVADEALGNVRTVRAFAMEDRQAGAYCAEVDRSSQLHERLGLGIAAFQGLSNLALNGIVLGTIFVGGSLMAGDGLSPGDLMSFLVASQTMQRSMANVSVLFGQVVRGLSAGARVFEFLTLEPSVALRGGARIPGHSLLGRICFHNVSFSYPTRPGYQVLRDFSLTLPPCKTVAIVGPSGGGKSTVAALLERFYEPTRGSITLDGCDISSLDPSWLRGQVIGFISQEPVLFGMTIMENIRFGKPGASDAEVYAAARLANADAFIRSFPEGYGTVVGKRGSAGLGLRAVPESRRRPPRAAVCRETRQGGFPSPMWFGFWGGGSSPWGGPGAPGGSSSLPSPAEGPGRSGSPRRRLPCALAQASAAWRSRGARSSASPSPGPSSRTPRCSSWTRPRAPWTPSRRRWCRRRWTGRSRAARCWSSPTASAPCRGPTSSWCWRRAAWPRRERTPSWCAGAASTRS